MVGLVLANSSEGLARLKGLSKKYNEEAMMLMTTITLKFFIDSFTKRLSSVPRPNPKPKMGPITGEINMAPMMTGMELTFKPTEAMMMAQAKMKTLVPLKAMFFLMDEVAFS
jgi:hypothetical protein